MYSNRTTLFFLTENKYFFNVCLQRKQKDLLHSPLCTVPTHLQEPDQQHKVNMIGEEGEYLSLTRLDRPSYDIRSIR